jgi:hypothetical protein
MSKQLPSITARKLISRQAAKNAKFLQGVMQGRAFSLAALRLGASLYPAAINLRLTSSSQARPLP